MLFLQRLLLICCGVLFFSCSDGSAAGTVTIDPAADFDGDGVLNSVEDLNHNGLFSDDDWDRDGIPDYEDSDDDNDGIPTADEVGNPADFTDYDNDNIADYLESAILDIDGDELANQFDNDDDGDSVPTCCELDPWQNDHANHADTWPADNDTDGDGTINAYDDDDDDDGIPTRNESAKNATDSSPLKWDTDDSGQPDFLEVDVYPEVKE